MKLSFHQHIALFWMIGAPGVFAPVIENAKRPDAGAVMAWGVAIVAVMILFTPLLLRCPPFRRWYGRTDALSERQRSGLGQFLETTLYETGLAIMHPHAANYFMHGKPPSLTGNEVANEPACRLLTGQVD